MKAIYLIIVILICSTLTNSAQIQPESVDWDTPQISSSFLPSVSDSGPLWIVKTDSISSSFLPSVSDSGPLWIVKTDSIEFVLDSLSTKRIDTEWIRSISVLKESTATVKYGGSGKNGVIIITLKEDHFKDFIKGKKPDTPLRIKRVPGQVD